MQSSGQSGGGLCYVDGYNYTLFKPIITQRKILSRRRVTKWPSSAAYKNGRIVFFASSQLTVIQLQEVAMSYIANL